MSPATVLVLWLTAASAEEPCKGWTHRPLIRKPGEKAEHSFTVDRDSPYGYSELRYAREKLMLDEVPVTIEHLGCEAWEGREARRYSFGFRLPPGGRPETDSGYWLKRTASLLKALGVCGKREEFPRDWCGQLRLGLALKPEYQSGGGPEKEGYTISFGFEPGGGEEVLRVLVDRRKDRVMLRVANALVRPRPAE